METTELVIVTERTDGDDPREQAAGMFAALAAHILRCRGKSPWDFATIEMLTVALHATASGYHMAEDAESGFMLERSVTGDLHAAVGLLGDLLRASAYAARGETEKAARLRRDALPLFKSATEVRP